jgi:excisionase family DNA binding protein
MEQHNSYDTGTRLLSVREACEWLGIGYYMIYKLIGKKDIKTVKLGRRRLISTRAIDEFINSMEQ